MFCLCRILVRVSVLFLFVFFGLSVFCVVGLVVVMWSVVKDISSIRVMMMFYFVMVLFWCGWGFVVDGGVVFLWMVVMLLLFWCDGCEVVCWLL